ncbi:MAG: NUDIX domain-containing protein [Firmicutes bacterium]|nr:NUDIX domain-containing protein [Bacillota bacterium]
MRDRAAVVMWCKKEKKVLLLHRIKHGRSYYVVPGGGVEDGESFQQAAVRELFEEVGVDIQEDALHPLCYHEDENGRNWYYYAICDALLDTRVGGPEAQRASADNIYEPLWIAVDDVSNIDLWPDYMRHEIAKHCIAKNDRTERVELTTMCLIEKDDMILLQDRHKDSWSGYALPGGHVEPGESIVAAVRREIKEETGLEIEDPQLIGVKQFPIEQGRYIVFLFKASKFTGTLISSDEGHMEWFCRTDIGGLKTVSDFADLMAVFDRPELNEFQYTIDPDGRWIIHLL